MLINNVSTISQEGKHSTQKKKGHARFQLDGLEAEWPFMINILSKNSPANEVNVEAL